MTQIEFPDGYFVQLFVRPSVSLVLNIDRYVGGQYATSQTDSRYGGMAFEGLFKHFRRFIELPGARITAMAVRAGEREEPVMRGQTLCLPTLDLLEPILLEALKQAFSWDIEQGLLPEHESLLPELARAITKEAQTGNRDKNLEFLEANEFLRRYVSGT